MANRSNVNWNALNVGDIVDVVAPASACQSAELRGAVSYLKGLGLKPRVPSGFLKPRFVFSNSDSFRFSHLAVSLLNNDSKAVWCVRGGYGSLRLLPMLGQLKRPHRAKLFIGLSDITSLHIFLNQEWNWPTIHAPVLARMGSSKSHSRERRELQDLVFGRLHENKFNLRPLNSYAKKARVRSSVVGGNLEVIGGGQGTPWQLETRGKILFVEEINERGYRVDRRLQNMKQAGQFDQLKAIIFGDFVGGEEPGSGRKMWKESINELAGTLKIPVYAGLHSGHGSLQRVLPLNTKAILSKSVLTCSTGLKL